MPETKSNGYSNGSRIHNGYEMEDDSSFLFTSESVGEGHPGEPQNSWVIPFWDMARRRKRKKKKFCLKMNEIES